ncbi:MAG: EAL domain-containing protein [Motiliproteus sp.]
MFKIRKFLSIANLLAILITIITLSVTHANLEEEQGLLSGQRESLVFSRSLQNTLRDLYTPLLNDSAINIGDYVGALNRVFADQTEGTTIMKLKIYNLQGRVVYSSFNDDIGTHTNKLHYRQALNEGIYTLPKNLDPDNQFGSRVEHILETYVPVMDVTGEHPIGVIEVYSDITEFKKLMESDIVLLTLVQVGVMLALYLVLLYIGHRAQQIIHSQSEVQDRQYKEIEDAKHSLERRVDERTKELMQSNSDLLAQMIEREKSDERGLRFSLAVDQSPASVIMTDADGHIQYTNPKFTEITGFKQHEVMGKTPRILKSGKTNPDVYKELWCSVKSGKKWQGELLNRKKNGEHYWEAVTITPIRNDNGEITNFISIKEDITDAKLKIEQLNIRNRAIEASPNAICIIDAMEERFPITYVNPSFSHTTGYEANEVIGKSFDLLFDNQQAGEQQGRFYQALLQQKSLSTVLNCVHKNGRQFWSQLNLSPVFNDQKTLTHFVAIVDDITDRKHNEEQLVQLATHDTLTGLPNRSLLQDQLLQSIADSKRRNNRCAVLFIDLDNFKMVNDNLGHSTGDQLLQEVARKLQHSVHDCDTVGRQSGDEFIIIINDIEDDTTVSKVVQRVLHNVAKPFSLDGKDLDITCSIGVSVYPDDGKDVDTLFRHADIAMYQAKETGRNNFVFFHHEMGKALSHKAQLNTDLKLAVEREEFILHYQPKVDLKSGRVVGAEALIRWIHPEKGYIPPNDFISTAEESGLILPIGEWVLRQACKDAQRWENLGYGDLTVSVNLSARQLQRQDIVALTRQALANSNLPANALDLEITESMVMENPEQMILILNSLRELGVTISIDDFGTGYSSLSYLKKFPIDRVKIDQSFVRNITTDRDDAAIANATISMSHNLRCKVVAEGVETLDQAMYLRHQGCDEMQGYLFSRPVPLNEFEALISSGRVQEFPAEKTPYKPPLALVKSQK